MRTSEEIKQMVQDNIHQIKISEFVAEGGWPNIENIEVQILSQKESKEIETVDLHILYTIEKPGCCFIPGREEFNMLAKQVTISNNKIEIT